MGFLEDRDLSNVPDIPEFFKGKTIFITGGSGFLGQALVEKLLYSCSDLDRIYLLMRQKRGVPAEDRLKALYESTCFIRLKKERPGLFESKVFVCTGDVAELGLGLSAEDRALIVNRVDIVIHGAASVRFDDSLQAAAKLNLRGTREVMDLVKEIRNLCAYIHISTSYTNTDRNPIHEVMYPPQADWRETLDICDNVDSATVETLTQKYIGSLPNTYTFTKQLAEHLVYEYKGKLPAVIIRPSIVICADQEPLPGWINNVNGPVGMFLASGKGILRSVYAFPELSPDYIPLDYVVKHIIAATWIRGTKKFEESDDLPVYNCCSGNIITISPSAMLFYGKKVHKEYPLDNSLWYPNCTITSSLFVHYLEVFFYQLIPAMLVDTILWLQGKKPLLFKIQRKIFAAGIALRYYSTQQWTFCHNNFLSLRSRIKEQDREQFYYDLESFDTEEYFHKSLLGGKMYLLKENMEDIPKAKAHFRRMEILNTIVKTIFYAALFWYIVNTTYVKQVYCFATNILL